MSKHFNYELILDLNQASEEVIAPGAIIFRGLCLALEQQILTSIEAIANEFPFRHLLTPSGKMSVSTTSCGTFGWVSDLKSYRYERCDPLSLKMWPPIPEYLSSLASNAACQAGYKNFIPDSCLINCYEPGAKMGLHQDKDEKDFEAPIVSISLGLPAVFLFGGLSRNDKAQRHLLNSGDIVVWGGASRLYYHGIMPLKAGFHPLFGERRLNLTFRKVT